MGPPLTPDLISVLVRFRQWQVGITSDITRAFLQVGVREQDRDSLRFLLRLEENDDIRHFRFCRVPFGLCCSSFLLNATLKVHLESMGTSSALKALRDLYVDDLITGGDSKDDVLDFVREINSAFRDAGMNLSKWKSNCPVVLDGINGIHRSEAGVDLSVIDPSDSKVLGMSWSQSNDVLMLSFKNHKQVVLNTKRKILKMLGQLFDPIGIVTSFVITLKIIFQRLWTFPLDWDDLIPKSLEDEASDWCRNLMRLTLSIPRRYFDESLSALAESGSLQMHVFCDASLRAYGSVVFLRRVRTDGSVELSFVMAKSRVAPLKSITLPRLELLAALIGSRFLACIRKSL